MPSFEAARAFLIVPLHGFSSDADFLELPEDCYIFKSEAIKDILQRWKDVPASVTKYLDLFPAEYVIMTELGYLVGVSYDKEEPQSPREIRIAWRLDEFDRCINRTLKLTKALRLFKPGHFTRGMMWLSMESKHGHLAGVRLSWAGDEQPKPGGQAARYRFGEAELPEFNQFYQALLSALENPGKFPGLDLALWYYGSSCSHKPAENQITDLFVCLEAALLQEKEELTFRLANRVANLLGAGAEDRKSLFREIRSFYQESRIS
jgi:hypothetical protein